MANQLRNVAGSSTKESKTMTKAQRIAHKIGNQARKLRLQSLYYKQSPAKRGWIPLGGLCQDGKYSQVVRKRLFAAATTA